MKIAKKIYQTINSTAHMDVDKKKIITLFYENVKGLKPNTDASNIKHSGKEGHWLEEKMGITKNASNSPDLYGYEMKNHTSSKTTFGDWSASDYIWKIPTYKISRDEFLQIFGKPNVKKDGRHSWSGEPCPCIDIYNNFGQMLKVDKDNNILIFYSFDKDMRTNKHLIVPMSMQKVDLVIAKWDSDLIRRRVKQKFGVKGWFKCLKDKNGRYSEIVFGAPITFENWIDGVKNGLIFFDSGMYFGNPRNYSQWRAYNAYWENLIISRH